MTTTGASADQWMPVTPGTEGVLALGIAHVILARRLRHGAPGRAAALIDGWSSGLAEYSPEKVEQATGLKAARVERLALQFAEEAPSVAMIAGPPLAQTNALFSALAVNALNELVGAVGQPGGVFFTPQMTGLRAPGSGPRQTLDAFAAAVNGGSRLAKVLLVDGVNPVFAAPRTWSVREAFDKAAFIVSFASFVDETSALADVILPDHSFLESWTEATPESGSIEAVLGVGAAVMKPLFNTRATPDVLLDIAAKLARPLDLPWKTFDEMLKSTFDGLGEGAWAAAQKQGGWWGTLPAHAAPAGTVATKGRETRASAVRFAEPVYDGDAGQYPFYFLPYPSLQFLDGSLAHLPWLQELPDPMTSAMWSSWVEINPKTAARLNVAQGDLVEIASSVGALRSPVFINPGIAPDLIAMPVGQGHSTFTRYASGRGQNPIEILAPVAEAETGALAWAATRVKVTRVGDPDGRLILFSAGAELREKPHEGEKR